MSRKKQMRIDTLTKWIIFQDCLEKQFFLYLNVLKWLLVKDHWTIYSADLGKSSNESYWDFLNMFHVFFNAFLHFKKNDFLTEDDRSGERFHVAA